MRSHFILIFTSLVHSTQCKLLYEGDQDLLIVLIQTLAVIIVLLLLLTIANNNCYCYCNVSDSGGKVVV